MEPFYVYYFKKLGKFLLLTVAAVVLGVGLSYVPFSYLPYVLLVLAVVWTAYWMYERSKFEYENQLRKQEYEEKMKKLRENKKGHGKVF